MNKEIFFRLTQLLEEVFDVPADEIAEDTRLFEDLGADELDMVELSMIIEEEFDFLTDDEKLKDIETVGDLCGYISESSDT